MLLAVVVTAVDVGDRDGARRLGGELRGRFPRLALLWEDAGHSGPHLAQAPWRIGGWVLEVVRGAVGQPGFHVIPKRWIVERTFGWLNRYRRLSKDYEELPETSEVMILIAMAHLMLQRCRK